jgi:two-component system OmpR family sensor kinase
LRLRIVSFQDEEVRRCIEADLDEMEEMIDATLAFLRDDLAAEKVAPVDLAAIIETVAGDASDAGHTVVVSSPRHLVADGRHLALKRAITNLTENALKYARAVSLSARHEDGCITISVTDDGPGIPSDKLEAVFEPFTRLDASRAPGRGGHGLGLTVARSIARAHGGDVRLRNRSPSGLEAVLSLPTKPRE